MRVTRCETGAEFLQRAESFLVAHEAENNLALGISNQLRLYPERVQLPPYLAVVEDGTGVQAAAVMTPPARLVLPLTDAPEAFRALAADVQTFYMPLLGVTGAEPVSRGFAEAWQQLTGETARQSMAERIYRLTQVVPPAGVPGAGRRAGGSDRDVLIEMFSAFELEAFGSLAGGIPERVDSFFEMSTRGVFLWEDAGRPVSMAGFGGLTPHGARVGPVYTPPALRGHGYASAMTAYLSQYLLDSGRQFCCLFTDLKNPTSNHIYQTIGYEPVCDVAELTFIPVASSPEGSLQ
jgi:predicted GNAT family acetyltransferase